jgi:predicted permease
MWSWRGIIAVLEYFVKTKEFQLCAFCSVQLQMNSTNEQKTAATRVRLPAKHIFVIALRSAMFGMWRARLKVGRCVGVSMETLWQDVRYGLRGLAKSPGFTAVAVLTLALGIGATTVMYAGIYAVLLRKLPFAEPDRLVMIWERDSGPKESTDDPSPADLRDWQQQSQSFEQVSAMVDRVYDVTGSGEPEEIHGASVSGNLFSLLGVTPALGRTLLPDDDHPGSRVVMISYGLWQRGFASKPQVIGQSLILDGQETSIVGVLPASFELVNREYDLWTPVAFTDTQANDRRSHYLSVLGRLKRGVSLRQAETEMTAIARRMAQLYPGTSGNGVALVPLHQQLVGDVGSSLLILFAAVVSVLLIACANIANLLLARTSSRRKEIAIRQALGASPSRLIRQLLTESTLLGVCGGLAGLLIAEWSAGLWRTLVPQNITGLAEIQINGNVLGFTAVLCLLATILSGLMPALTFSKADPQEFLKAGGKSSFTSLRTGIREGLVVSEVALAFVLLISAGLLIRSFARLQAVDPGFHSDHLLTLRITLPRTKYANLARRVAFYDQVVERVESIPEVKAASLITFLPLTFGGGSTILTIEGRPAPPSGQGPLAAYRQVGADYFRAMRIPLLQGRFFDSPDMSDTAATAIINQTMERQLWPGENPIGKRIKLGPADSQEPWVSVVGVVGDVRQFALEAPAALEVYVPYTRSAAFFFAPRDLIVRTGSDPLRLAAAIKSAIWSVDSDQPVSNIQTMDEVLSQAVAQPRFYMVLLGIFAALALMLGSVGLYGVMAYSTAQRTQEIGVRMALGAEPQDVLRLVLMRGAKLTVAGLCLGLAGALAVTHLMKSLLFGVGANDPLTFVGVAVVISAVALASSYIPARRATCVDPMVALRHE